MWLLMILCHKPNKMRQALKPSDSADSWCPEIYLLSIAVRYRQDPNKLTLKVITEPNNALCRDSHNHYEVSNIEYFTVRVSTLYWY